MSVPTITNQSSGTCQQIGLFGPYQKNGTNSTHPEIGDDASKIVVTILTSLLSFAIIVGNGLIIMSVTVVKKLRQPANYLIVSLALSDFLVGLIVLPLTTIYDSVGEWIFGPMVCDIHVSFDVICCTASIMNLCIISIDRYMMITKPMTYPKRRTPKFVLLLIAAAWLMSCIIIIPALFGFTENVKDSASWIYPAPFNETEKIKVEESTSNLDPNDAYIYNNTRSLHYWTQIFELKVDYKIIKLRFDKPVSKEVVQVHLQGEICGEEERRVSESTFFVDPCSWGKEISLQDDFAGKFLRLTLNISEWENSSQVENFQVFAEKIGGKTCLISQEVWFTIYSTVGAFYLPLAIMLFMYGKIYREASKFKPSRKSQYSRGNSLDLNDAATPVLNSHSLDRSYNSSQTLFSDNNRINNNPVNIKVSLTPHNTASSELGNSRENMIIKTFQSPEDQNRQLCFSDYHPIDDVAFEDDTRSSICESCDVKNCNPDRQFENSDESVKRKDLAFLTGLKETIIGDLDDLDDNDTSSIKISDEPNRKYSSPFSLPSRRGNFKSLKPTSRTWSLGDAETKFGQLDPTNSSSFARTMSLTSSSNSRAFKTNLSCPPILENNVLELPKKGNNTSELNLSQAGDLQLKSNGLKNKNPSKSVSGYDRSKPRHSIFSATSLTGFKPLINRNETFRRRNLSNGCVANSNQQYCSPKRSRKSSTFSRYGRIGISRIRKCIDKKGAVLKNIKHRVSSTPSRERMRNVKATRTLGIIVGVFTFCWLPFFIVTFIRPFICENPESQDCIPLLLVRIVLWLGYVNSALNPLIYIGFSPDLRKSFRYLLSCKCTNVDRRLAQDELRSVISREKRSTLTSLQAATESIM